MTETHIINYHNRNKNVLVKCNSNSKLRVWIFSSLCKPFPLNTKTKNEQKTQKGKYVKLKEAPSLLMETLHVSPVRPSLISGTYISFCEKILRKWQTAHAHKKNKISFKTAACQCRVQTQLHSSVMVEPAGKRTVFSFTLSTACQPLRVNVDLRNKLFTVIIASDLRCSSWPLTLLLFVCLLP